MIADGLDRMVLLLLVAGGAALALGAVGIVNPAWATDHSAFLTMAGAAVPFLSVVAVHVRQSMLDADASRKHTDADTQLRLAQAENVRRLQDESANAQKGTATPPQAQAGASTDAHWSVFWRLLAQAGDAYGFTQSNLTTDGTLTKVMSEQAWNTTIPMFVASGWLSGGKPGRATKWATGRGLALFEEVEGWKALPHPETEPPEIALPPYTATLRRATTSATPEKRTITGVRAD